MASYEKNLANFLNSWTKNQNLKFAIKIQDKFPRAKIYLVGGIIRDLALGRNSVDYDFVISGVPQKKLEASLKKLGKIDFVGKAFGVYKFRPFLNLNSKFSKKIPSSGPPLLATDAIDIDIALPRTEHSFGTGGYKDVKAKSNYKLPIEKDLERRDFTINAMALKLQINSKLKIKNLLIDPFNGLKDIKTKKIRAVGKPEERFKEDYSRMLRAIRLSCQLGFDIEKNTWSAIRKKIKNLNNKINDKRIVPQEVIAKELVKTFKEDPALAIKMLEASGAIKTLMPELLKIKKCPQPKNFHSEGDVWTHTILALKNLQSKKFAREFSISALRFPGKIRTKKSKLKIPTEVVWGLIFHDIGKPYTITFEDRIRFNNHDSKSVKLWEKIAERLRLSSAGLNVEVVSKIIGKHMLPTHGKPEMMKETTIEKYFFNDNFPGQELLMLIYADIMATVPPSGKPDFSSYKTLKKRIANLQKSGRGKEKKLPKELLNGNEIIKILNIKPGPMIGQIKTRLREAQLLGKIKNKKEAGLFIKNNPNLGL